MARSETAELGGRQGPEAWDAGSADGPGEAEAPIPVVASLERSQRDWSPSPERVPRSRGGSRPHRRPARQPVEAPPTLGAVVVRPGPGQSLDDGILQAQR
eukprot:15093336-Alexandrium_andersonii.AAC.1